MNLMGEANYNQELPVYQSNIIARSPELADLQVIEITSTSSNREYSNNYEANEQDAWLPITESRNGNVFSVTFHLLSSGIGFQALLLPLAFSTLGWAWGAACMSVAFLWQLYTIWLLVQLHESPPGIRYSRYLQLSMAAFGGKLGRLLAIFPVMYLSGGSCVMLIITGGGTMKLFFNIICDSCSDSLSGVEWFLVFTCLAIAVAQLPNLNSVTGISVIGAITAVSYFTLLWVLSIRKGRPSGVSYDPLQDSKSDMGKMCSVLNAIGIIALSFRGHNLVLEIQGTLPTNLKQSTKKPMLKGVTVSYLIIALCLFPVAIGGFWVYGDEVPSIGGVLNAFSKFHGPNTSKSIMGLIYLLIVVNSVSSFQVYAMPVFDNLEIRYTSMKKKKCPRWVRVGFRLFFGGIAYLVAVAFPFLGSLAGLIGGMALPLTYAYPCFMWAAIKKDSAIRSLSFILGCIGIVMSVLLVVAAAWNLADKGLDANFFDPR